MKTLFQPCSVAGLLFFVVKCACFCQPKLECPSEEKRNLNGSPELKVWYIMQKCRLIFENWKYWKLLESWEFLHLLLDDLLHYNFLPIPIKIISKNLTHTTFWKNVEVGEVDNSSSNIKASPELNHHEMVIIQHEKEQGNILWRREREWRQNIISASGKKKKKMENSESDLKNSDTIVQAEVEICYSTK